MPPGIDELLIRTALDAGLRSRMLAAPEEVFEEFDLTPEERDLLRAPDQRLLPLLGAALLRQAGSTAAAVPDAAPGGPGEPAESPSATGGEETAPAPLPAPPAINLLLRLYPYLRPPEPDMSRLGYAIKLDPIAPGADPSALPPPALSEFPGERLPPLALLVRVTPTLSTGPSGEEQVAFWASLETVSATPGQAAGAPSGSAGPSVRPDGSAAVAAAAAAVQSASPETRYDKLLELIQAIEAEKEGA